MSPRRLTPEQLAAVEAREQRVYQAIEQALARRYEVGQLFVRGENTLPTTEDGSQLTALELASLQHERKKIAGILEGKRWVLGRTAYVASLMSEDKPH